MSEPIVERLSKFTPDGTGINRDALLFAAGRASARPNRRWRALCGALVASQLLTLGVALWPRAAVPLPALVAPVVVTKPPLAPVPQAPALWQLRDQALATDGNLPLVAPIEHLVASEPPLHAFGMLPKSLID